MHMAFLLAQVPQKKSTVDFKQTIFEFEAKDIHPLDQINMHKQTRQMVYSTFTQASITTSKRQLSLNNVQSQLKLDKVSSLSKDNRNKYLEKMVSRAGFDPDNSKSMEKIIKKKNADIVALKMQLNLPTTEDPHAKELGETQLQKYEMLKLLVQQSAQIKEMEAEMDKMIKEKEHSSQLTMVPLDAVPIVSLLQTGIPTIATTSGMSSSIVLPT